MSNRYTKLKYRITREGDIYGIKNGKKLRPFVTGVIGSQYLAVNLTIDGVLKKSQTVHRLVASKYIPNPYNLPEVNHIDENKLNNHVDNLEWCTHKENMRHSAKLSPSQVVSIRILLASGKYKQREIAEIFGVGRKNISNIKRNKIWV